MITESSGKVARKSRSKHADNIAKKEIRMTDSGIGREGNEEKALH